MQAKILKRKYIDFFVKKGHRRLPNVSLLPENDPSALFISAGMHPLVPYLLGEPHPQGKRLVSLQRCLRTTDIDEVGDSTHNSFFEMLGNWSLGDYWKKEAITFSFEFLTKGLKIPPNKLYVTCFAGDKDAPRDEESAKIWQSLGIPRKRIFFFGKKDNWWGPAGQTGPCGPDTEIFVDTGKKPCSQDCKPGCFCGKYFEVWNDVFMEYNKTPEGQYKPLKQKNVDTGMGVERTAAVLQGSSDVYETEVFAPIIKKIEEVSGKGYKYEENKQSMRIVADHTRAAVFAIADGVEPSNVEAGYIVRRLIRRAIVNEYSLEEKPVILVEFLEEGYKLKPIIDSIIDFYKVEYAHLKRESSNIQRAISEEWEKFGTGLRKGYPVLIKILEKSGKVIRGKDAFRLFDTYGIQLEVTEQAAQKYDKRVDRDGFEKAFKRHQKISRTGASKKFAGGLADHSEEVTKLHTATHLLHAALRQVLGEEVAQKGSNITAERLRFDFSWGEKLTPDQIKKTEEIVNGKIKENLPVEMEIVSLEEAKKKGAMALFGQRYAEKVKTYRVGSPAKPFSFEVCGGPHVDFTGTLGKFKIIKEESAASGIRRIYARLS